MRRVAIVHSLNMIGRDSSLGVNLVGTRLMHLLESIKKGLNKSKRLWLRIFRNWLWLKPNLAGVVEFCDSAGTCRVTPA